MEAGAAPHQQLERSRPGELRLGHTSVHPTLPSLPLALGQRSGYTPNRLKGRREKPGRGEPVTAAAPGGLRPTTLRSRCRTLILCMKRIPSQICLTNTMVSTSVKW